MCFTGVQLSLSGKRPTFFFNLPAADSDTRIKNQVFGSSSGFLSLRSSFIFFDSSSGRNGLLIKPFAPSFIACPAMKLLAVNTITGTWEKARNSLSTSNPLIGTMSTSRSTISGLSDFMIWRASFPLVVVITS